MNNRYDASNRLLQRAEQTIPLGSQTFSKSRVQFPPGISPLFIERGRGARVIDVDGNEYLDFINGLLCVTLGYADPTVNAAISAQLERGISFSLPSPLETEVAELLVDLIPCAEMVRFGKNGTDATSAAVRLARACTGREHVALCGYHGWQDWSIGTTSRSLGVPAAVQALSHTFTYNAPEELAQLLTARDVAAVVMEPMAAEAPAPGFLERVRELCDRHGALLVFDETITGCRFAQGGAQALFGVTPDLATVGKGIANGMPLSAVVGPARLMRRMEDIFFSGTFGGETLSLAAAKVVLEAVRDDGLVERLAETGDRLLTGLREVIDAAGAGRVFGTAGHPSWSFLTITPPAGHTVPEIRTWLMQRCFERGFLTTGSHNISAAHTARDVDALLALYAELLPEAIALLAANRLRDALQGPVFEPVFRVRNT